MLGAKMSLNAPIDQSIIDTQEAMKALLKAERETVASLRELNGELVSALRTIAAEMDRVKFPTTMRCVDALIARAEKETR